MYILLDSVFPKNSVRALAGVFLSCNSNNNCITTNGFDNRHSVFLSSSELLETCFVHGTFSVKTG